MQTLAHSTITREEAQLVVAARLGETFGLVEYIYKEKLPDRARKLAHMFRETCGARLDVDDIIQAGIVYVLARLNKAIETAVDPIAYLIHAAQFAMLHYCQEQRCSIRVPHSSQHQGGRVPVVASLDAPMAEGDDLTLLDLVAG